jgi:hypothetical protein
MLLALLHRNNQMINRAIRTLDDEAATIFIALMKAHRTSSWFSKKNCDGTLCDGVLLAAIDTPHGTIAYYVPSQFFATLMNGAYILQYKGTPFISGIDKNNVKTMRNWIGMWNPHK